MVNENLHPTDQDLLLLADGELPARRAAQIREHLAACWDCRSRMAEIEGTISEFMRMHHQTLDPQLPPIAGPRALLKAQLAELSRRENESPYPTERRTFNIWAAAACFLVLAMGGIFLYRHTRKFQPEAPFDTSSLPDPRLTPGVATDADINVLCSTRHDEVVRPVPNALQEAVLQEYGLPPARAQNFEIDFLISPGLGGVESIRNLWPEPRYDTLWNSFVKDQLEDYLHESVCDGRVSLKRAQQDIAGDWISAYQKYFHTKEPLAAVSGLPGVNARSPVSFFPSRAPATLEAAHWGIARAIAVWAPYAYRATNTEPADKYYSWFAVRHTGLFLWN